MSKKNLTPEELSERKEKNKKIFKFGCLPLLILMALISVFDTDNVSESAKTIIEYNDPLRIGRENVQALVGTKVPYEKWDVWGSPETLEGTDNTNWVVYLDSANISFVSNKSTDIITFADLNKSSATSYIDAKKARRKAQIEKGFSAWDGSHINLTEVLKKSMNDPDSYEHVETNYFDMNDHLVIITKYRGNNAFGGKVLGYIKAKATLDGQVTEIMEQQ